MSTPVTRIITTFGYVGLLPHLPGTWGSLAALPCAWALHWLGGFPLLLVATLVVIAVGTWATQVELVGRELEDPSEIVIDEVAGMWIALFPLSLGLWMMGAPAHLFPWPGWLGAFVLFRILDMAKPWPMSWADRQKGSAGVMLDDILAGIITALVMALAAALAHGWLM
jgi:phosphatidylglycerophosphatase A